MLIIVFISFYLANSSVNRRSETKVDEQGRKYHYSERYEEEFSYEIQKRCSDDDSEGQLQFENDLKYDDDLEGLTETKNAEEKEDPHKQKDEKANENEDEYYKEEDIVQQKKVKQREEELETESFEPQLTNKTRQLDKD